MTPQNLLAEDPLVSAAPLAEEDCTPAITWLNMTGDVTITWDADSREYIKAVS